MSGSNVRKFRQGTPALSLASSTARLWPRLGCRSARCDHRYCGFNPEIFTTSCHSRAPWLRRRAPLPACWAESARRQKGIAAASPCRRRSPCAAAESLSTTARGVPVGTT